MRYNLAISAILIVIIVISLFVAAKWANNLAKKPEFFVGIELAYSYSNDTKAEVMVNDVKLMVDKVKEYTNLFVIGSVELTFNQTALNEACDYIKNAGLYFVVLLTGRNSYSYPQQPFDWLTQAQIRYGEKFLGVYRFDEPGGNQLDQGLSKLLFAENSSQYTMQTAASNFTYYLGAHLDPFAHPSQDETIPLFTADYGLYWFDYAAGYNNVLTEFGSNHSRPINIALARGAANAQQQNWGAIVTWTYDEPPYIESADALYEDLKLAYNNGAKYAVIFDFPKNASNGPYGLLTEQHFAAMQKFWKDIHASGQAKKQATSVEVAYVIPSDYGFGFRRADDTIWGLWPADTLSTKVWNDVNMLIQKYNYSFDIVYNDAKFRNYFDNNYETIIYWNQIIN